MISTSRRHITNRCLALAMRFERSSIIDPGRVRRRPAAQYSMSAAAIQNEQASAWLDYPGGALAARGRGRQDSARCKASRRPSRAAEELPTRFRLIFNLKTAKAI